MLGLGAMRSLLAVSATRNFSPPPRPPGIQLQQRARITGSGAEATVIEPTSGPEPFPEEV